MSKDLVSQLNKLKQRVIGSISDEKQRKAVLAYDAEKKESIESLSPRVNFFRGIEQVCKMYPNIWFLDLTSAEMVTFVGELSGSEKVYKGKLHDIERFVMEKGKANTLEICKEFKIKNKDFARNMMRELHWRNAEFTYVRPDASQQKGHPSELVFVGGKKKAVDYKSKYTRGTIDTYMQQIRAFFTWMNGGVVPASLVWMNKRNKKKHSFPTVTIEGRQISATDLLSLDEIERIIKSTDSSRNKALIILLYETAARNSEFRYLKINDVQKTKHGITINIPYEGKTGFRPVPVVKSVPYLLDYLNVHKDRDNLSAPLFYSLSTRFKEIKLIEDNSLNAMIKNWSRDAGIRKNIFPHLFRHSRITELVRRGINESILRAFAGWTPDSDMPKTYVHLAGIDVSKAILKIHGIIDEEENIIEKKLMPLYCDTCGVKDKTLYPATAKFCNFGHFLKVEDAIKQLEEKEVMEEQAKIQLNLINKMLLDPNVGKAMAEAIKKEDPKSHIVDFDDDALKILGEIQKQLLEKEGIQNATINDAIKHLADRASPQFKKRMESATEADIKKMQVQEKMEEQ